MKNFALFLCLFGTFLGSAGDSFAQSNKNNLLNSDPQTLARGIGHFERSRSLLLAAIREFDEGYKQVSTDQVLDANAWRKTLLSRAEELETILSPKAREIKGGSAYQPDSRLLGPKANPPAKIKKDQVVKPDVVKNPEAKPEPSPTKHSEGLDLELSGS